MTTEANLFKEVGAGTPAGSGNGYGLILEQNKPIQVTYNNLTNTSYNGKRINRLIYTYELLSTFAEDKKATAFVYTDPTKTIYVGTHGQNKGQVDFSIKQTMTYFFEDGSPVVFDKDKTALLSFASRNNSFEFGEQEFVQLGSNLSFIPITGSSVSGEEGYVAARASNNTKADGSKYDRSEWDQDGHVNEYYGAGVALVTGDTISFTFGIRYNPQDIQQASKPSGLRDRSRQWFTVNADIKASGLLNTEKPGTPPSEPSKPAILTKVIEAPTKPVQPVKPTAVQLQKPTAPKKPILKDIPPLPPLTLTATKPRAPKVPVLIIQELHYKAPSTRVIANRPPKPTRPHIPLQKNNSQKRLNPSANPPLLNRGYSAPAVPTYYGQRNYYAPAPVPLAPAPTPYYAPSWTSGRTSSPKIPTPAPTPPKNTNQSQDAKKTNKPKKSQPLDIRGKAIDSKDHFGLNTGISKKSGDQQNLIAFIEEVGKEARNKYKNFSGSPAHHKQLMDRDIALALAHKDYSNDRLQNYFNKFGKEPTGPASRLGKDILSKQHNQEYNASNVRLDLSHTMTTLASTYQSGFLSSGIKFVSSLGASPLGGTLPINPFSPYSYLPNFNTSAVLQLNSLTGDLFTTMNQDDINADMDSMILARHPKYKNMPMDQRIIAYYSQPNLDQKRKDLFLSIYSKNRKKAQDKAVAEILLATMTVGGFFLVKEAKDSKKFKDAYKNIRTLDRELFDGKLEKKFQNSLPYYFNPFTAETIEETRKAEKELSNKQKAKKAGLLIDSNPFLNQAPTENKKAKKDSSKKAKKQEDSKALKEKKAAMTKQVITADPVGKILASKPQKKKGKSVKQGGKKQKKEELLPINPFLTSVKPKQNKGKKNSASKKKENKKSSKKQKQVKTLPKTSPAPKPAQKATAKARLKSATKPVQKATAKPAHRPAARPAHKPATRPTQRNHSSNKRRRR